MLEWTPARRDPFYDKRGWKMDGLCDNAVTEAPHYSYSVYLHGTPPSCLILDRKPSIQ